jgi:hypothetical protein
MAAVIATTSSRSSPMRTISSPNTEVQDGPLDGASGSQVSGSITPTVWKRSSSCARAGS